MNKEKMLEISESFKPNQYEDAFQEIVYDLLCLRRIAREKCISIKALKITLNNIDIIKKWHTQEGQLYEGKILGIVIHPIEEIKNE